MFRLIRNFIDYTTNTENAGWTLTKLIPLQFPQALRTGHICRGSAGFFSISIKSFLKENNRLLRIKELKLFI